MNEKDIRKSIRKHIFENLGKWTGFDSKEMMGAAKQAAMQDIKASGEEFVDLGKSKFEKDLSIEDMINDLENAKQGKTGKNLDMIQKQINQLKRFGGGSLNEFEEDEFEGPAKEAAKKDIKADGGKFVDLGKSKFEKNLDKEKLFKDLKSVNEENLDENYFVEKYADELEGKMDKTKPYTEKEFLDLFTQKHALQHSSVMNDLKNELRDRGFKIEGSLNEDVDGEYMYSQNLNLIKDAADFLLSEINDGNMQDWVEDKISKVAENMRAMRDFYKFGEKNDGTKEVEEGIGTSLSMEKGMNVKENVVDEDSLEFRKTSGQRQKSRKGVSLEKHAPHSQAALKDEGAGISLTMKRGMNVKPTQK